MTNKNLLLSELAKNGMTARDLSADIGMTKNSFSNKINGKTSFTIEEAKKICDRLNISDDNIKCAIFLA